MIAIPGGTFRMGSDKHYPEEAPVHRVTVDAFFIDRTPVTNRQFKASVRATGHKTFAEIPPDPKDYPGAPPHMIYAGSLVFTPPERPIDLRDWSQWWSLMKGANWRHPAGPKSNINALDNHPVVHVTFADALAYAKWAGKDLSTEAEWEFAARGGLDSAEYAWGDEFAPGGKHMANTWQGEFPHQNLNHDGFARTSPVTAFPPNGYGVHDMIGNVWEWTTDWYSRKHEADVTIVERLPLPLHQVLGDTIAEVFRDLHTANGVTWRFNAGVAEFTGQDGRVTGVRLEDGDTVPADLVVVAIGAMPRVELAHAAGLELSDSVPGGGVDTDATLRTSAPDVYAAGDIAAQFHPRYERRLRVEHWANAKDQGAHVAGNLLDANEPYTRSPYFFSDQYDLGMEVRGLANPFRDELVVRGDLDAREFIAFWLRDGAVHAAMNVNMWDDGDALQSLVDTRATVEPNRLQDAELASLVG